MLIQIRILDITYFWD